ncbi:outer membrane protein assembly factor BamE [Wenzhouxiangella limi]|uniref:Outer membrane protein assembly factor BamE n=1 Tax=Wenzhouxiangella limi TaxID=2707351 RepID=A0A845V3I8_9GAMM|nr:outer membrane protein assembly factor BamE [Wenzhouxiangella limi]NDY94555.1 outer membrane protein assembly factor BamE [Wenzhouxiangella limi]
MRLIASAILLTVLITVLTGCNLVYKQDIQQGNVLDDDNVAQLDTGMTKRQVLVLLGSPSVQSPFHDDRWDYMNTFAPRGGKPVKRVLTLRFEDERLSSVEGSYLEQDTVAARALRELQAPDEVPIQDLESIRRDGN